MPQLLAVASGHSVVKKIARALYWAQTSRRLRRLPLAARITLLTDLLERRVRRLGRRNAERQIVDFYCRSQLLLESTKTETETKASRYSVSWPTVRQMLVRRTVEAWGDDVAELSADMLSTADLNNKGSRSIQSSNCSAKATKSSDDDLMLLMMSQPVSSSRKTDDLLTHTHCGSPANPINVTMEDEIWNENCTFEEEGVASNATCRP